MNTLYYGLLAILSNHPLSGYDLMLTINAFWHVPHSRIYPLLAKLENDTLVKYTLVEQKGKPDKKVYSITEDGENLVKEWLLKPADESVKREEILLRTYSLHLLDKESAVRMLKNRERILTEKINRREKRIEQIKNECGSKMSSHNSHLFSAYILNKKLISEAVMEIKWCRWVISLYEEENCINFFEIDFPES